MRYIFNQWFISKNYVNPIPSKEISATHYLRFFNYTFIPFLEKLGIEDDVRKISDLHITELQLNMFAANGRAEKREQFLKEPPLNKTMSKSKGKEVSASQGLGV